MQHRSVDEVINRIEVEEANLEVVVDSDFVTTKPTCQICGKFGHSAEKMLLPWRHEVHGILLLQFTDSSRTPRSFMRLLHNVIHKEHSFYVAS
ncbi:hypothetical protein Syun_003460 [Stephania yunnanensis]|uniref:Uncharacterized protein n=1 Tax=Stephania yunnanensis TaxID=152371 RepID=A0AAP0L2Q1_9MAGN